MFSSAVQGIFLVLVEAAVITFRYQISQRRLLWRADGGGRDGGREGWMDGGLPERLLMKVVCSCGANALRDPPPLSRSTARVCALDR